MTDCHRRFLGCDGLLRFWLRLLVGRVLRVPGVRRIPSGAWLGESALVERDVRLDPFPRILRLVRRRAVLRANGNREREINAAHRFVVAQLDLELALGAAHDAQHLVFDRHGRIGVEVVRAYVAVAGERELELVDIGPLDLVRADELELVALLAIV